MLNTGGHQEECLACKDGNGVVAWYLSGAYVLADASTAAPLLMSLKFRC